MNVPLKAICYALWARNGVQIAAENSDNVSLRRFTAKARFSSSLFVFFWRFRSFAISEKNNFLLRLHTSNFKCICDSIEIGWRVLPPEKKASRSYRKSRSTARRERWTITWADLWTVTSFINALSSHSTDDDNFVCFFFDGVHEAAFVFFPKNWN